MHFDGAGDADQSRDYNPLMNIPQTLTYICVKSYMYLVFTQTNDILNTNTMIPGACNQALSENADSLYVCKLSHFAPAPSRLCRAVPCFDTGYIGRQVAKKTGNHIQDRQPFSISRLSTV